MAIKLFGFNISRDDEKEKENVKSFTPPHNDDGTVAVNEGGAYGSVASCSRAVRGESRSFQVLPVHNRHRFELSSAQSVQVSSLCASSDRVFLDQAIA